MITADHFPAHEPPIAATAAEPTEPNQTRPRRRPKPQEGRQLFASRKEFNRDLVSFNAALDEALGAESCLETHWPYNQFPDKETMRGIVMETREDVRSKRQEAGHS